MGIRLLLHPMVCDHLHGWCAHEGAHGKPAHIRILIEIDPGSHLQAGADRNGLQIRPCKLRDIHSNGILDAFHSAFGYCDPHQR